MARQPTSGAMTTRAQSRTMTTRAQSRGEEIANSVSHGVALLAALAAGPLMIAAINQRGQASLIGVAVFTLTMVLLYSTSTLCHALPAGRAKRIVLKLDHGAIYIFIADSYTPFALDALSSVYGWAMFSLVWCLALAGVTLKACGRLNQVWLSTGLYLLLGWLVLAAALPLLAHLPPDTRALLVAGGLAYSGGVVFFMLDSRLVYAHAVWHCFVVAGTACHLFAVLDYAA